MPRWSIEIRFCKMNIGEDVEKRLQNAFNAPSTPSKQCLGRSHSLGSLGGKQGVEVTRMEAFSIPRYGNSRSHELNLELSR
jgi:hypothetical protein